MNTCISVLHFFANRKRLCEKRSDAVITTVRGIIDERIDFHDVKRAILTANIGITLYIK